MPAATWVLVASSESHGIYRRYIWWMWLASMAIVIIKRYWDRIVYYSSSGDTMSFSMSTWISFYTLVIMMVWVIIQPNEPLAPLVTTNRVIIVYGFIVVIMLLMYSILHFVGNKNYYYVYPYRSFLQETNTWTMHVAGTTANILSLIICAI